MEYTGNNIEYDLSVVSTHGARFTLYPKLNVHSEQDVKKARSWLYHNKNVVSIQIRWKNQDDKLDPPQKIPDYVIISELKLEIGKLNCELFELEDQIKEIKENAITEEKKEILKEELYRNIKKENSKLREEIKTLRSSISKLVVKLSALESKTE